jgi:predicted helicase
LQAFLTTGTPTVDSAKELAVRMAALARLIRDIIRRAFNEEDLTDDEPDPLHEQLEGFRQVLLHDLTPEQFADMYAQTICYGLFAARCNAGGAERFTRQSAGFALPRTNPFLRKMFNYIAGADLDERIVWAVDDLTELLHHTDMEAVLKDFGKHTRQEDPVVHFYESFLAAYDPRMREARGVYYTPESVVSYIVRSIDHILKTDFKLPDGLADATKIKVTHPNSKKKKMDVHKVQILDPATGTGTFLYGIVDQIYNAFRNDKGMWSSYVSQHLLPRLFGFELLMAPYAVAHMKLGLQLKETGYDFKSSERVRIYLTNTLEEAHEMAGLSLFTQWIAEEANAAGDIKKDAPVMVVLGNPPYSVTSMNKGFVEPIRLHYYPNDGIKEANPKVLLDDYVKFIRFAQERIEKTGYGILAFISNHGYLDNPVFRRMRQSLMETFDDIYILDLHGNSKKKERCPDGSEDKNVFDIQQGVSIGIFVRKNKTTKKSCYHAELYGFRHSKYQWLAESDISSTTWNALMPTAPFYLFAQQDTQLLPEYEGGWKLSDLFLVTSTGVKTHRDHFVFDYEYQPLQKRISEFRDPSLTDSEIEERNDLKDTRDWKLSERRKSLMSDETWTDSFTKCLYRPFDLREYYHHKDVVELPRHEVMKHLLLGDNLAFVATRQVTSLDFSHVFCSRRSIEMKTCSHDRATNIFPLYLYSDGKEEFFHTSKNLNLSPEFIEKVAIRLEMKFISDGKGDRIKTFGPEDIFSYMYAVFHSLTYRRRYAEFLKVDFPRLPLTSNPELFRMLCSLGDKLVALHLMEKHGQKLTSYPIAGDGAVETVRYTEPHGDAKGRVWINATQYFEGIPPAVWEFHVGGYQVCAKWLKDRKGRKLTYDDLTHYQHVVAALAETIKMMATIDETISDFGGWPIS